MIQHIKCVAKKKSVIGLASLLAITGTVTAVKFNQPPQPVRYVLAAATRGTLVVSVNGSGQVSGENQLDIKPAVSGKVKRVVVKAGDPVKAGDALLEIDKKAALKTIRDATQAVSDARLSLGSTELSLQKLKQPPDVLAVLQAQNSLNQAERNLDSLKAGTDAIDIKQAENELALAEQAVQLSADGLTPKTVRDAYDNVAVSLKSSAPTLQQALTDADAILGIDNPNLNDAYEKYLSALNSSSIYEARAAYAGAKAAQATFKLDADALAVSGSDAASIDTTLVAGQAAAGALDTLLQKTIDVVVYTMPSATYGQSSLDALRNSIQSDRTSVASKLTSFTTQAQNITQAKNAYAGALVNVEKAQAALDKLKAGTDAKDIAAAEERVAELKASLVKLQAGVDPIDLAQSNNSVAQRRSSLAAAQNRLNDALETLADYTVRAPFDGVMARVQIQPSQDVSSGTALATLLTNAKIAQVTLNEVDVSKVHPQEKATLTFDALPDLTIAGVVSDVDPLGTVTQGVVSYAVKIVFVTQDDRIKPGMSVASSIVTEMRMDTLLVPGVAVRGAGDGATVQVLAGVKAEGAATTEGMASAAAPQLRAIQIGLSNDQNVEVTSGLNEGDSIVVRTIDPATATASRTTPGSSSTRLPGMGSFGGGGGAGRAATGR